jgi:hypothetical protein
MEPISLVTVVTKRNGSLYPITYPYMYILMSRFLATAFLLYAVYAVLYTGSYKDSVFQFN